MRVNGQRMDQDITVERSDIVKLVLQQTETGKSSQGEESKKKIIQENLQAKPVRANREDLEVATEIMNKAMKLSNYHLEFKLHEKSGHYQVKVVDSDSNKVIREIPAENVLEYVAQVRNMLDKMIGLLVDEKV